MHLDEQALFSDQQAITTSAASTNFINLGAVNTPPGGSNAIKADWGGGINIPLLIQVTEDFAGGTSLRIDFQTDDNSSFSSAFTVANTPTFQTSLLKAGFILPIPVLPPETKEQYLRLNYVVSGTYTAGKITAGIAGGLQTNG